MDNEKGVVVSIENKDVVVEFYRSSACKKCGACTMAKDTGKMEIHLPYTKDVNVGDEVYVDVGNNFYFISTALLYVLPLIVLIGTIVLGLNIFKGDNAQMFAALLGIALSFGTYFALKAFKKLFAKMKEKNMTYFKA